MNNEWNPKHFDENGNEYEVTETGARRPPMRTSRKTSKPGEFTTYDDSQGHCELCGRLTCRGTCLK